MAKKSILYIMSVDWEWIYQRPHILAEMLGQDYEVTVIFPRFIWQRKLSLKTRISELHLCPLWKLPFQERNVFIEKISRWINNKLFKNMDTFNYIYVGYPLYMRYIPETFRGKIIYDCMDNFEALCPFEKCVVKLKKYEKELVKKCDLLIVTSEVLRQKMDGLAGEKKSILIRNGATLGKVMDVKHARTKAMYDICYIGTISRWLDTDIIKKSLQSNTNIRYQLIGPYEEKVEDSRVSYHGPIKHEKLGDITKDYDCFVMPFLLNDIVEAVDPVKLYEYIAFGKCIISVYYPEIERFSDFVYFYRDTEEYVKLLNELEKKGFPPKYSKEQQIEFLKDNTWEQRYQALKKELNKMEEQQNEN